MHLDRDTLEREYSPSSRAGGSSAPYIADYTTRSAVATASLGERLVTLEGGSLHVEAGPGAPLLVFVHGGYWQALSAAASTYLAPGALTLGWSYAALEYTVAPDATVTRMVDECVDALDAVLARCTVPPSRVVLAGHSAGAHLVAMLTLDGRAARCSAVVDRAVLLSGVFDLRPLVATSINEPLGLDPGSAASLSPMLHPPSDPTGRPQVVVAWGDGDTDSFAAQSRHYAAVLAAVGLDVTVVERAGRHHFDVVDDLVDASSELGAAVVSVTE